MKDRDKWPAMHAYRKAVAAGDAEPIKCPECDADVVPVVHPKSEGPSLRCLSCNSLYVPGIHVWNQIAGVIKTLNYNRDFGEG